MKREISLAIVSLYCAAFACAQADSHFEVAVIKPHPVSAEDNRKSTGFAGNQMTLPASAVDVIIQYSFDLKKYQLLGAPRWATEWANGYEITAKAPGDQPLNLETARPMLQALLVDRFQLKTHWEKRDLDVYSLVVGKNGSKLKEAPVGFKAHGMSSTGQVVTIAVAQSTVATLATALSYYSDRPVRDHTNLSGTFAVNLNFVANPNAVTVNSPPSLFTALEEQLGLRLEPQKEQIDVLVVDHVERPSEN